MAQIRLAVTEKVLHDPARVTLHMYADFLEKDARGFAAEIDGAVVAFNYANRTDESIWALFLALGFEGWGAGQAIATVGYRLTVRAEV